MRKISIEACRAFYDKRNYKKSNTQVSIDSLGDVKMTLFGNDIAWTRRGEIKFSLCGWGSITTLERLRTLGIPLKKSRGLVYLRDQYLPDLYASYDSGLCMNNRPDWLRNVNR